jgi:hypothetical protein
MGNTSIKLDTPLLSKPVTEKDSLETSTPTIKVSIDLSSLRDLDRQETPPDQSSIVTRALSPNQPIMAKGGREHTELRVLGPRMKQSSPAFLQIFIS